MKNIMFTLVILASLVGWAMAAGPHGGGGQPGVHVGVGGGHVDVHAGNTNVHVDAHHGSFGPTHQFPSQHQIHVIAPQHEWNHNEFHNYHGFGLGLYPYHSRYGYPYYYNYPYYYYYSGAVYYYYNLYDNTWYYWDATIPGWVPVYNYGLSN